MRNRQKTVVAVIELFRSMEAKGVLSPQQKEALTSAMELLRHAAATGKKSDVNRAIDRIAKALLR